MISIPESVHAILSPSKAHMWTKCKGALGAARGLPSRPASRYAAEGTVYHDVSRRALVEGKDCSAYIGDQYEVGGFTFTVDADNADYAQVYVDSVRAIPGKRFVEVDLEYSELLGVPKTSDLTGAPIAAGTGDLVVLDYENKIIWSLDLKFGRGDVVYASEVDPKTDARLPNPQLALYAAAAVARYELLGIEDDWLVKMGISQPRVHHVDWHEMTVGALKAWTVAQRPAANRAYVLWSQGAERVDPMLDLTPGEKQCRWCPLSGNCVAQNASILDNFPKGHAVEAVKTLVTLDDVEVAQALDLADEVENWLSAVRAEGLARVLQGRTLPNWKLVTGRRGTRDLDETATVELDVTALNEIGIEDPTEPSKLQIEDAIHFALGNGAYQPRKLLTVAKLEKPLAKKSPLLWAAIQQHITQADGKPSLAPMTDPRAPVALMTPEFPVTGPGAGLL